MSRTHAKGQYQRSLGPKVETDGRTDGGDHTTSRANAVGDNCCFIYHLHIHLFEEPDIISVL